MRALDVPVSFGIASWLIAAGVWADDGRASAGPGPGAGSAPATRTADAAPSCRPGPPRAFKLPPSTRLGELASGLLGPMDLVAADSGISVVVVTFPFPCRQRLVEARVRVWDGFVVQQRSRSVRAMLSLSNVFRRERAPWLPWVEDDRWSTRRRYCLKRRTRLGRGGSWVSHINGHGVVLMPVASNSVTGADFRLTAERPPRHRERYHVRGVKIPGPSAPHSELETLHRLLGW